MDRGQDKGNLYSGPILYTRSTGKQDMTFTISERLEIHQKLRKKPLLAKMGQLYTLSPLLVTSVTMSAVHSRESNYISM